MSEEKRNPAPKGKGMGKGKPEPKSSRGKMVPTPSVPAHLKISIQYLAWRQAANALSVKLSPFGMSVSELGKSIADYRARGSSFEFDKVLVAAYADYEATRLAWVTFRDHFRAENDARGVPTGAAADLLAALKVQ
jgi:hypothetical protein